MRKNERTWLRRLTGVLLTALLVLSLAAALAAERFPYTTTTTDKVNLRRSASSTAVVLTRVPKGESVKVTGKTGNYYKVTYGKYTGYILKTYLTPYEETADAQATPEVVTGYPYQTTVNAKVNLRESNSQVSRVIRAIPSGAAVTVMGETGKYAYLQYGDDVGYARKEYVNMKKVVKATPTPSPAPTLAPGADKVSYQLLQRGSEGEAVLALQNALTELGFMTQAQADGRYGDLTVSAVMAFQLKNGYPQNGVADANLQAFLYSGKPLNASGVKTTVKTLAPIEGVSVYAGSKGSLVGTIQTRLQELGYYSGPITQVNDTATAAALKAFQKANGLKADGVAGAQTQTLLFSGGAVASGATPTPAPTPTPTPAPTFRVPAASVGNGSTGENARLVQQRLKDLGYYTGKVDGKFGSGSVSALKRFQSNNGLKADGVAGTTTYAVLFSWNALAATETPTPAPAAVTPTPVPVATPVPTPVEVTRENTVTVQLGVTGDAVLRLQERLTVLGYYQSALDGVCKADDVAAIRTFQQMNGLKVDGVAGYATQVKLYSQTAVLYSGAIAAGTVNTATTLRMGSTGNEVTLLQERLAALGYYTGKADGIYSIATSNAVIAFQRANSLTRDGVAGTKTLKKLYSSEAVKASVATPTPAPKATSAPASSGTAVSLNTDSTLKLGDNSEAVKNLQQRLIDLGYLNGRADGKFGTATFTALKAFQKSNRLTADGVAGPKTLKALESTAALSADGKALATPTPTPVPAAPANVKPRASQVQYGDWYTKVKALTKKFQYATVYDYQTGLSWQVHMFSFGAHADAEPLTAADTARLEQAFGGNTWNPRPVWVVLGNGDVYMASTHSMPHEVQHITSNNFPGHLCIHFPRTAAQVAAIGPYATSHQSTIDAGWKVTQNMR